jgi:hypothetical protein
MERVNSLLNISKQIIWPIYLISIRIFVIIAGGFIFHLLSFEKSYAQADYTILVKDSACVHGSFRNFYTDAMGNVYFQMANDAIMKTSSQGDSVGLFNDVRRFGKLETVDVSNPLKLVLFYKDFGSFVVLDRFLKLRNSVELRLAGILQPTAVAQSYDNNYWVFDAVENKLHKIDDHGQKAFSTPDFRLLFSERFVPQAILDDNTRLYLYDSSYGWMLFDYYGAFLQKIPAPGWQHIQISENKLCGLYSGKWQEYDYKTFTCSTLTLPVHLMTSSKIVKTNNVWKVLAGSGLCSYKFSIE